MDIPIEIIIDIIIQSNSYALLLKFALTCKTINNDKIIKRLMNKYRESYTAYTISSMLAIYVLDNVCVLSIHTSDAKVLCEEFMKYTKTKYYALKTLVYDLQGTYTINVLNTSNKMIIREIKFYKYDAICITRIDSYLLMYYIKKKYMLIFF